MSWETTNEKKAMKGTQESFDGQKGEGTGRIGPKTTTTRNEEGALWGKRVSRGACEDGSRAGREGGEVKQKSGGVDHTAKAQ